MSENSTTQSVDLNELFEVLSDQYRRRTLTELRDRSGESVECDPAALGGASDGSERVGLELHHTHLPKLADAGVIEWDDGDGTVSPGPRFDDVAPVIDVLRANEEVLPDDWP